jgi:hypothetical protein
MNVTGFTMSASERQLLETGMQALRDPFVQAEPDESFDRLLGFRRDSDRLTDAMRQRLFASSLIADEADNAAVRWMCTQHHRMARLAKRVAESLARRYGLRDDRVMQAAAIALNHMAESVKGEVAAGFRDSHHHARAHAVMRLAMDAGRHREPITCRLAGEEIRCTIEALYLRALLLSRISTGGLSMRQVEIFDAYFMHHLEVLKGFDAPPDASTWRADLDSATGLRAGVRKEPGVAIYLPLQPLADALDAIAAEFHAGRMFPAAGPASQFPVEDHVAVQGLMRRTLRVWRRGPVGRAKRHAVTAHVEVQVGLAAIMAKGFARSRGTLRATLATVDGLRTESSRRQTDYGNAIASMYDPAKRVLQLVNISHTGIGLEGDEAPCADIAAGDLIGIQLHDGEPMVVAKVVRRAVGSEGRVTLGVQRVSSAARVIQCRSEEGDRREVQLLYVPGEEKSGHRDLVVGAESLATDRRVFATRAAGKDFTLRINRIRERGRGWVFAGFEVLGKQVSETSPTPRTCAGRR